MIASGVKWNLAKHTLYGQKFVENSPSHSNEAAGHPIAWNVIWSWPLFWKELGVRLWEFAPIQSTEHL